MAAVILTNSRTNVQEDRQCGGVDLGFQGVLRVGLDSVMAVDF